MVGNLSISGRMMPYINLKGNAHDILSFGSMCFVMLMYISQYSNEEEN